MIYIVSLLSILWLIIVVSSTTNEQYGSPCLPTAGESPLAFVSQEEMVFLLRLRSSSGACKNASHLWRY